MNNLVQIKVTNYITRFMRKCHEHEISLYNIDYLNEEEILVKIEIKDLKKIRSLNYYAKIRVIKYLGTMGFKMHLKKYMYIYVMVFLCFILMQIMTSYIMRIDIIHENQKIRNLVAEELALNNVKKFSLAKNFNELEVIKNKILAANQAKLEWLSITRVGMTYVVHIEERVITDTTKEEGFAHIISSKDAMVTKIISNQGDVIVRSGDYVRKGEVLISGALKVYDEIKGNTLATGEVYGNVWYNADILFPLVYEEKKYTDKKRYNISLNNKILCKNKYRYFEQKNLKKFKIFGLKISLYQEYEYKLMQKKYTNEEAEKLALAKVASEMQKKLNKQGVVISKKVLQKTKINSTISMSVFIIASELISVREYYTPGSDGIDSPNSN